MKSFFIVSVFALCFSVAQAQQDTTLKEYVGSYTFPEGSFVLSADVTLKDTVLTVSSAQGASDLAKKAKDTFALLSYNGTIYFKRNAAGKVAGMKVEVEDMVIEGTKEGVTAWLHRKKPAVVRTKPIVK